MRPGPTTRPRSLRRRLSEAQLTDLQIGVPAKTPRSLARRRRTTPRGWLRAVLIVLLVQCMLVASGSREPASPAPLVTFHMSLPQAAARSATVPQAAPIVTSRNVDDLARILMSEAAPGVANEVERVAVGYTVINRMQRAESASVRDVWRAYARHAAPNDQLRVLARRILRREVADISGGATHFYSPRSMPRLGDRVAGFDVSGGLEQTNGLRSQNYRPGWATLFEPVAIDGVRATHFKFYRVASAGPVR